MRLVSLALLLGMLSACATQTPPPQTPASDRAAHSESMRWAERIARLETMKQWQVRGKVAYRLPDDAGSASLDWQQQGQHSNLRLSGPLGAGSTHIQGDASVLRVARDGIDRSYPADAAPWLPDGSLLPVPVQSIQHWLRGVPDPAQTVQVLRRDNALATHIEQGGWIIDYADYRNEAGLPMPSRLTLEQVEAGLTLRLILRDWTLITAH